MKIMSVVLRSVNNKVSPVIISINFSVCPYICVECRYVCSRLLF